MNRKVIVAIGVGILILLGYFQWGREVKVCSGRTQNSGEYRSENITIVANTLCIGNKKEFAMQMIQRCIDNSFKEIKFSYDLGYPNELSIDVYMSEALWKHRNQSFTIYFVQEEKMIINIISEITQRNLG